LGVGAAKPIGEISGLKMCVDIACDRLPISGGNEIIIIQKQKPLTARAVCADVARGARAEPTFGFYSHGAQCLNQVTCAPLKLCAIVDDNHFGTVGQGSLDGPQRLCQQGLAIVGWYNHRIFNAHIAHLLTFWFRLRP